MEAIEQSFSNNSILNDNDFNDRLAFQRQIWIWKFERRIRFTCKTCPLLSSPSDEELKYPARRTRHR